MEKQPVILQLLPALRSGGVERGTLEMARAIRAAGGVALVASSGGPMVAPLLQLGARHFQLPLNRKTPLNLWLNSRRIARIIREHKVDIVHARSRAPAWSGWWAAKRTGCHFMTTFHGFYGLQNEWKRKYNAIMTKGERVIAISDFIAKHIREHYPIDESRLRIIHRGVDLKLFDPSKKSTERLINLAKEWRLPDLPMILFPGRITRWKGQDVFIRALARLPHRNFFAIILGDKKDHSRYHRELMKLITECQLEGHVRLADHTQHIADAYKLARLVIATSVKPEAFGRVVIEAQAMGRPVITTNHGGPQETVIPDVTGWLVPPADADALAGAIHYALSLDDAAMAEIGANAIANAQNFSIEEMCRKTLDIYRELLA